MSDYKSILNNIKQQEAKNRVYERPTDLPLLPHVYLNEQKLVGLYAIYPDDSNFLTLALNTSNNGIPVRVDWGDGLGLHEENAGVTLSHIYNYEECSAPVCSGGYKIVTVVVTGFLLTLDSENMDNPMTYMANITGIDLSQKNPNTDANALALTRGGLLDILITGQYITDLYVSLNPVETSLYALERFELRKNSIQNFSNLFFKAHQLKEAIFTDTTNATNMANMFYDCHSLLRAPEMTTTNVTDFSGLFYRCKEIVHVPTYDTTNVTLMPATFYECIKLVSLPPLNTSKVTNFAEFCYGCSSLRYVQPFDTSKATSLLSMFNFCYNLIDFPVLSCALATTTASMYALCTQLKEAPALNLSGVLDVNSMFNGCTNLIKVPQYNLSSATNTSTMFQDCKKLKYIPPLSIPNATTISYMFYGSGIEYSPISSINGAVTSLSYMFRSCYNLKAIPALNLNAVTNLSNFCTGCSSVGTFDATNINITFSISYMNLSNMELLRIYNNLPTVTSKTITVTGNPGCPYDNPAIATAKGLTVTG